MRHIHYKRAPLVELIAEIRWPVDGPPAPDGSVRAPVIDPSAAFDRWCCALLRALAGAGFTDVERVVPHGAPVLQHQPVLRFRRPDARFPVVQFGHGVFTVNGGPPTYHSWRQFRPYVEWGIRACLENRPSEKHPPRIDFFNLRYIDVFDDYLRDGLPVREFIEHKLGVAIDAPDHRLKQAADFGITMQTQLDEDTALRVQIGAGTIDRPDSATPPAPRRPDAILDLACTRARTTDLSTEAALLVFDAAYAELHELFENLTQRIRDRMEPMEEGD